VIVCLGRRNHLRRGSLLEEGNRTFRTFGSSRRTNVSSVLN